jgi:hypothetical protein
VCGNGRCEPPYETCINCQFDCGQCDVVDCMTVVQCLAGCGEGPYSPSCTANCTSRACADVMYFVDQAFYCMWDHIEECGALDNWACHRQYCGEEFQACLNASCE